MDVNLFTYLILHGIPTCISFIYITALTYFVKYDKDDPLYVDEDFKNEGLLKITITSLIPYVNIIFTYGAILHLVFGKTNLINLTQNLLDEIDENVNK